MEPNQAVPLGHVYLLAENRLLRETLLHHLQKKAELVTVGVGRCSDATAEQILASSCEMLLLDSLDAPNAANLVGGLLEACPEIKVVLFGMDEDAGAFLHAVRLGIVGYVLKDASAAEIIEAILAVAQGRAVCPPSLCSVLFEFVRSEHWQKVVPIGGLKLRPKFGLTTRQCQLLELVARDMTNKEIAAKLNLSEFTVKNHLRRIMRQLDVQSRSEAVQFVRATATVQSA